jgi:tetratricopeptide (TPR) repeat protein
MLTRPISLNPTAARSYSIRANIYARSGQLDLALADLGECLKMEPTFSRDTSIVGSSRAAREITTPLLPILVRQIRLKPKFADAFLNRGIAFERQRRLTSSR